MLGNKRYWLLAFALMFIFAIVGCSKSEKTSSNKDGNTGTSSSGDEVEELVTFNFFDGFQPGTDINTSETTIGKMFEEATGVNFDIEHIVGDVATKIGTMNASGDYPHLLNAEQSTDQVISAGGFRPLNDLIEEHAPNIKELYGPYLELMKHEDGNIYVISSGASHGYAPETSLNQGAFWVQREVLKEFNYPELKTLDDYLELIEAYAKKYPEIDGAQTIGYTALTYDWRFFAFSNTAMHLAGYPNDGEVIVDMDTLDATVYSDKDIMKRYLKEMNELNAKGLFDQESFVQNYDEYLAKIASGRVLGFFDYGWQVGQAFDNLKDGDDPYKRYMGFPIVFDEDIKDQYLDPPGFVASPGMGITVSATDEEAVRIIKYLDHIAKEENQKLITWGIEGEHYDELDDGTFTRTEDHIALTEDQDYREEFGFKYFEWGWPRANGLFSDGNVVEPGRSPEIAQLSYDEIDREFLDAYGIETWTTNFTEPDDRPWFPAWDTHIEQGSAAQLYEQQADDLRKSSFPRIVMSDPSDFEAEWNTFVEEFSKLDYEEYEKVLTEGVNRTVELMQASH
jgi:putative aldouronate transport system substrate-binding protein